MHNTYVFVGKHHSGGSLNVRTKEGFRTLLANLGHHIFDRGRSKMCESFSRSSTTSDGAGHGFEDRVRVPRKSHVQDFGPSIGKPTVAQDHGLLAIRNKLTRHCFHAERPGTVMFTNQRSLRQKEGLRRPGRSERAKRKNRIPSAVSQQNNIVTTHPGIMATLFALYVCFRSTFRSRMTCPNGALIKFRLRSV